MGWCSAEVKTDARVEGKTCIITGCNTGIGKPTVQELVKRGCRVIMACRSVRKAEEAKLEIEQNLADVGNTGRIEIIELDLSSLNSVRKCAQEILDNEPKIDILICNAGISMTPHSLTEDGYELQFATNHLGHFLFTLLLLPRILESAPARIIMVASDAHKIGSINFDDLHGQKKYSPFGAYAQSKLANMLFAYELGKKLAGTQVSTYSLHPGVVATEIARNMDASMFRGASFMFGGVTRLFFKSPTQGAQTTLHCALDEQAATETGLYYYDCKAQSPYDRARDDAVAKRLWDESIKMVKLEGYDPFKVGQREMAI